MTQTISVREYLSPLPLTNAEGNRGRHWMKHEVGSCIWLILDREGVSTNTFNEEVFSELDALLGEVENGAWDTVVFRSAKPSGFAAGADLSEFREVEAGAHLDRRIADANAVIDRIASLRATTIAVVHGTCVGGGLELALACDRIVAREDAKLGFPEIMVGLHPGLGGTARLTRRIQPVEAMTLMLTGKTIDAHKARASGLVDAVVPERNIEKAVRAAMSGEMDRRRASTGSDLLNLYPARLAAGRRMRAESDKRAPHEHFPAPYALIELWERHGGSLEDMLAAERESFARLLPLPSTQNLIRDFFLRRHLKANAKGESGIGRIHVVGAGAMGADIGAWCALKGMQVTLEDPQNGALAKAVANANELFARKLSGSERIAAQDRFIPDPDGTGLRHADLVIEAAPEKEDLKRSIYQRIEAEVGADVILATNTSSLDLEALALGLEHPGRFVGLHFFNPVSKMDLVEVVRHERVDQTVLSRAMALVGAIGKLPLPSAATPGFLVNRALLPYLGEALLMVRHGMQPERVDAAAESFGMPLGPVELADQVGLDICLAVARSLSDQPGNGLDAVREWLEAKVGQGELGRKSGKGFYEYDDNGKPIKQPVGKSDEDQDPGDIVDRLIMPLLNEVAGALEESVIDDEDSADAAMVFGAGFAPFRGGPMKYARQRGLDDVADRLEQLAREHGTRFEPREWWRKAAR